MNFAICSIVFVLFPSWLFYIFKHYIDILEAFSYRTNITSLQQASNVYKVHTHKVQEPFQEITVYGQILTEFCQKFQIQLLN